MFWIRQLFIQQDSFGHDDTSVLVVQLDCVVRAGNERGRNKRHQPGYQTRKTKTIKRKKAPRMHEH